MYACMQGSRHSTWHIQGQLLLLTVLRTVLPTQAILESDPFKIMYDRREDRNSHGKLLAKGIHHCMHPLVYVFIHLQGCGCENDWDCLQKVHFFLSCPRLMDILMTMHTFK